MQNIQSQWENARSSLWFIPAILVVLSVLISFLLLSVDRSVTMNFDDKYWIFNGSPGAARTLLATIASATITVISISFSLTIIAIQQASTQYSPRVLRTFTSDLGNQIVLGAYIATFAYSLLILRAVRGDDGTAASAFVPHIAASFAIILALLCIGLLVYFINHIAKSLQAITIISIVHEDLIKQLRILYPAPYEPKLQKNTPPRPTASYHTVTAQQHGFILSLDIDALASIDKSAVRSLYFVRGVGDFVSTGQPIARVLCSEDNLSQTTERVRDALVIGPHRSSTQDPLFPVRQLVDIAIKALSKGINDQTTAEYCIHHLTDALCYLADREIPGGTVRHDKTKVLLHTQEPTWELFITNSFNQIMNESNTKPNVMHVLLNAIEAIAHSVTTPSRTQPLKQAVTTIEFNLNQHDFTPYDVVLLHDHIKHVRAALNKI